MNTALPLLEAQQLDVAIGGHDVCRALNFQLRAGERLAILGRNGAGKSTLLSTLAGLRPLQAPQCGKVLLAGQDIFAMPPRAAARLRGWLGQNPADPFAASVLDTVLTGRHPHLARWDWESAGDFAIASAAIKALGLAGLEARSTQNLSGGERQRAALATLLTQQPQLYLLDEPLAHLDLNHQIAVLDLFTAMAREENVAVVMVLHDPGLALRYCDHALLLFGDGRAEFGKSAEILEQDRLSSLYGHPLQRLGADHHITFLPL
jgi:iron complex transport system ATP-binding protein